MCPVFSDQSYRHAYQCHSQQSRQHPGGSHGADREVTGPGSRGQPPTFGTAAVRLVKHKTKFSWPVFVILMELKTWDPVQQSYLE